MWDWELLKNGGEHGYEILSKFGNEDFQYTHAVSRGTPEDDYCLHSHAMYEIVYCVDGDVIYMADGMRYVVEPGGLLILSPAVPHKLFICSSKPYERHVLYVYFAGNSSALCALTARCQRPIDDRKVGSAYYRPGDVAMLREDFDRIGEAARSDKEYIRALTPCFAEALIAHLLMAIDEKRPAGFTHSASKTMDGLMLFLNQNFTRALSLQEIADAFAISRDHCNRLFRQATGMTVMQYVLYCRVLYAKQLLTDGVPAMETARRAGFADYSNFYRAYRKVTGRAPSDDYEIAETVVEK